ncbi:MAG: flippase-like domain-containing protein [Candidatus Heimdallarchaeota archaeon]|nr:MAG: flippase-like domain-containing protein [Candidatus Heimdallarchaeota archaeon]
METSSNFPLEDSEISLRKVFDKKTLFLLSFAAVALSVYLYLGGVSIFDMISIMMNAIRYNFLILVLGTLFTFIAVLIDTLAWRILMGISTIRPSVSSVYRIQLASFSYGLLIPSAGAIEGIMRIALGVQEFDNEEENRNATSGEILASVLAHKLLGLIAFIPISMFVAFSLLAFFDVSSDVAIYFVVIISLLSIVVVTFFILVAKSPKTAKKAVLFILRQVSRVPLIGKSAENALEPSEKIIDDFSVQFTYLAKNKLASLSALILAFFSQIAHWLAIYFILTSLPDLTISLSQVAAINFLGGTVDFLPVGIPGMAGLKEIALSISLDAILLDTDLAASAAILLQLMKFYLVIVIGLLVYVIGKSRVTTQDSKEDVF